MSTYTRYWGHCDDCEVTVIAESGPDRSDVPLPDPNDWEDFGLRCPVCGDTVPGGYGGADDETTESLKVELARALARARQAEAERDEAHAALARVETLVKEYQSMVNPAPYTTERALIERLAALAGGDDRVQHPTE